MVKSVSIFVSLVMIIILSFTLAYSAEQATQSVIRLAPKNLEPYLLREMEMKDMVLADQYPAMWKARGNDGAVKVNAGVKQKWVAADGKEILVSYHAFSSPEEAFDKIGSYPLFNNLPFQEGPYSAMSLGDFSWSSTKDVGATVVTMKKHIIVVVETTADVKGEESKLEGLAFRVLSKLPADKEVAK